MKKQAKEVKLEWTTQQRKVADLVKLEINPRKISEKKKAELISSIEEFNLVEIPAVDFDDTIISGNQRVMILMAVGRGDELIDVRVPNRKLTEKELKKYNIIANTHAGEFDFELLELNFADIELGDLSIDLEKIEFEQSEDFDKQLTVFKTVKEKNKQAAIIPETTEGDDDAPDELPSQPFVVRGDIFEIRLQNNCKYRVGCLDSTNSDGIEKLMQGEKADMVFTDPPYGINWNTDYTRFKGGLIPSENKYSKIENDEKDFEPSYLLSNFKRHLFFGANCFSDKLPKGNWIVWDKRFENGEAFLADAEVAWYNGNGAIYIIKETHQGFVSSDEKRYHPTQKPVNLLLKIFEKINVPNVLFDGFTGSGSTMVACIKTERSCYTNDISERYVQVAVKRAITFLQKNNIAYEITLNNQEFDVAKLLNC